MKRINTICAALMLTAGAFLPQLASAQVPQKMSYQAVIRNNSDVLIASTTVGIRIEILQGSESGSSVYTETHTPQTNANGLVSLEIGSGTIVSGAFADVNWEEGPYFIKTETDPSGGTNYSIVGTSELLSVPFAMYSANGGAAGPQGPEGPIGPTGPPGATGAAGIGFDDGTVVNQMKYWNGSAWVNLSPGVDGQVLTICGDTLTWTTGGVCQPTYPEGSVFCFGETSIVDVTNPITGKVWMDRNLGASQVAGSSTDQASYGDLYQWGRNSDGHQCRTSPTTTLISACDQQGLGEFIIATTAPYDWRSPQNPNLWQGINGTNNPCPETYRLPTDSELDAERLSWSINNATGAFESPLKWPMAGFRQSNGTLISVDTEGAYWSSTVSGANSDRLFFDASDAAVNGRRRGLGLSVRCIRD